MIGIVLVGYGDIAKSFVAAIEQIMGQQDHIAAIGVERDDDLERRRDEILRAVEAVDTGNGVCILADLPGGTACNLALSIVTDIRLQVLAGVNLPMLIKIVSVRNILPLALAVEQAELYGKKYLGSAIKILTAD